MLETLMETIDAIDRLLVTHERYLEDSRGAVQTLIVTELLQALDWPIDNPRHVRIHDTQSRDGDSVLTLLGVEGEPRAEVHTRPLKKAPPKKPQPLDSTIRYTIATDGNRYQVSRRFGDQEIPLFDIALKTTYGYTATALLSQLWWGNLATRYTCIGDKRDEQKEEEPGGDRWLTLEEFIEQGWQRAKKLRFATGEVAEIPGSAHTVSLAANNLIDRGVLIRESCPIQVPGATKRYLINTRPYHPTGKGFTQPHELKQNLYCETHASGPQNVGNVIYLLREVGEGPKKYHLLPQETEVINDPGPRRTNHWIALTDLNLEEHEKPRSITFRGKKTQTTHWVSMLRAIADTLCDEGRINPGQCPIPFERNNLVHTEAKNPSGTDFSKSHLVLSNGLHLNDFGSRETVVKKAIALMDYLHVSTDEVTLEIPAVRKHSPVP